MPSSFGSEIWFLCEKNQLLIILQNLSTYPLTRIMESVLWNDLIPYLRSRVLRTIKKHFHYNKKASKNQLEAEITNEFKKLISFIRSCFNLDRSLDHMVFFWLRLFEIGHIVQCQNAILFIWNPFSQGTYQLYSR